METKKEYTIEQQAEMGKRIAEILGIKKNREGRYMTEWGSKTALGIYNTVLRLGTEIEEGSIHDTLDLTFE